MSKMPSMGQINYEAYRKYLGTHATLTWNHLSPETRLAWIAAAFAVAAQVGIIQAGLERVRFPE